MVTRSARKEHAPMTVRLPFAASSVAVARQQLTAWMRAEGCSGETIEDARVVISELVGNSVRHASALADGSILVTWGLEPTGIRISVTDGGGSSRPRTLHASALAVSGRGMAIVEALVVDWWSEHTRTRSTLHALLAPG